MSKTFAEVLNEHTKHYSELTNRAQKLITQAKKSGGIQEKERLLLEAEKIMETVQSAIQDFDTKHGKDVENLISYINAEKKRRELQEQVVNSSSE